MESMLYSLYSTVRFPFTVYISTQTKLWELDTRNFILAATKDTP